MISLEPQTDLVVWNTCNVLDILEYDQTNMFTDLHPMQSKESRLCLRKKEVKG